VVGEAASKIGTLMFDVIVQCSIVRCHLGNTYVPQDTRSSAVRSVLKLNDQAIGVREVEFRGPFFCASTIFHSHADVVYQGSRRSLCTSSRLDAVAFERLDDLFRIEIVHSPSHGTWHDTGHRNFTATFIFFRFNSDGTPAGTQKVTRNIIVEPNPDEFNAVAAIEIFDVSGNLISTGCATETAQRFK